jgi:hypothetical protein
MFRYILIDGIRTISAGILLQHRGACKVKTEEGKAKLAWQGRTGPGRAGEREGSRRRNEVNVPQEYVGGHRPQRAS